MRKKGRSPAVSSFFHTFFIQYNLRSLTLAMSERNKKSSEASKIVTSPYLRTAEAIFGGRKSG